MARRSFTLPREHGFWTMLAAVQLAAVVRSGVGAALLASLVLVGVLSVLGGLGSRAVRRRRSLQLASAAVLGVSGLPVELAFGVPWPSALATAACWVIMFGAGALLVHGAFARASRKRGPAIHYEAGACLLGALGAIGLALGGFALQASALGAATCCLAGLASHRPTPKQVKSLGLALAGMNAGVAVLLLFESMA